MKNFLFVLLLVPMISFGQNLAPGQNDLKKSIDIKYYGKNFFSLEGTLIPDSLKQNRYDRLPISYKEIVVASINEDWSMWPSTWFICEPFQRSSHFENSADLPFPTSPELS